MYFAFLVDCEWNEWVIGECSEECGDGIQTMTRTIKAKEQFGGKPCEGEKSIEETCFIKECARKDDLQINTYSFSKF